MTGKGVKASGSAGKHRRPARPRRSRLKAKFKKKGKVKATVKVTSKNAGKKIRQVDRQGQVGRTAQQFGDGRPSGRPSSLVWRTLRSLSCPVRSGSWGTTGKLYSCPYGHAFATAG